MPRLTFCNLPKLAGCKHPETILMQNSDNFRAGHQNTPSLLPRGPRFVRYETRLSRDELAGPNVEFSRHAARKPILARYRRMPRGRLQFLVGTSLPPLTFCNLPKLPGCERPETILMHDSDHFRAAAPPKHREFATARPAICSL